MQRGSQPCSLGNIQFCNTLTGTGDKQNQTRIFAWSSFEVNGIARKAMNRAAAALSGSPVLGIEVIDNTPGFTFALVIQGEPENLDEVVEQWCKQFRKELTTNRPALNIDDAMIRYSEAGIYRSSEDGIRPGS